MIRLLALASLMLVTVFAVPAQAAECGTEDPDEVCYYEQENCESEGNETCAYYYEMACDDCPSLNNDCGGEVCAYGSPDCIDCSYVVDDTGGEGGDGTETQTSVSRGVPGFPIVLGLAGIGLAFVMGRLRQ